MLKRRVRDISPAGPRRIAVRYLGDEAGNQFTDANLTETSIVIRMRPQRWLSFDYSDE